MGNRVVITGVGVVSSIGIGKDAFWKALISGTSGISKVEAFDTSSYSRHYGGEVKNFHPEDFLNRRKLPRIGRASQFAIAAAKLALKDAGLGVKNKFYKNERSGVIMGTTMAESQVIEKMDKVWSEQNDKEVDNGLVFQYPANVIAVNVGIELGLKGFNFTIPTACAAGNYAIGYAFDLLSAGEADFMLAGGSDAFSRIAFTGFNSLYAVAEEKCQPFDKNRKGMMVGEGAGMVVLETLDNALKRNADIYAEVLGYGLSCDANHMTAPDWQGIAKAIEKALVNSGIGVDEVDYISAHGTGTPANDKTECLAIKEVFKNNYKDIPVSSIKSMLGHTMGAASAIEAIACALAIKNDTLPATINYETPDPDCDIDCVPNKARRKKINIALNNGFAFGGNNSCLALKKVSESQSVRES